MKRLMTRNPLKEEKSKDKTMEYVLAASIVLAGIGIAVYLMKKK